MNDPIISESGIVNVTFGKNVKVVNPVNLYGCRIGDDCFIGPFVEIQRNAAIGRRCKIQSHAFICELVSIGDDCFVSHGAMFINDLFKKGEPAGGEKSQWTPTSIGNHVCIGKSAILIASPMTMKANPTRTAFES